MSDKIKVVVTDYIEDNLDWEAEKLVERGIILLFILRSTMKQGILSMPKPWL